MADRIDWLCVFGRTMLAGVLCKRRSWRNGFIAYGHCYLWLRRDPLCQAHAFKLHRLSVRQPCSLCLGRQVLSVGKIVGSACQQWCAELRHVLRYQSKSRLECLRKLCAVIKTALIGYSFQRGRRSCLPHQRLVCAVEPLIANDLGDASIGFKGAIEV